MSVRPATLEDCLDLARLANMSGEGIPAACWEGALRAGESIEETGARLLAAPDGNFSYRNAHVAERDGRVAGMLLAYRLTEEVLDEDLDALPPYVRPMVELEQRAVGSFYLNMLATYPQFRGLRVGTRLMALVDTLALTAGCEWASVQVFEENAGALRLYERLGYRTVDRRPAVPDACHPYTGDILLLTRRAVAP